MPATNTANHLVMPPGTSQPRRYYGWLVVAASFVVVLLSTGIQSSFGNFLKPMSAEFGWDRSTASLPAALAIFMNGLFQPFVGRLIDRYGHDE
jgi:MFS family permease